MTEEVVPAEDDGYLSRVAQKAGSIRFARLFLGLLVLPLYALGFLAAALWCAGAWLVAGLSVGWADARDRFAPSTSEEA